MAIEKRKENGFFHQVVDEFHGGIKLLRRWRRRGIRVPEQIIADYTGKIDFTRRAGENVSH